jgi:hypothetical protein
MLEDVEEQDDLNCGRRIVQVVDASPSCSPMGFAGVPVQVETGQIA